MLSLTEVFAQEIMINNQEDYSEVYAFIPFSQYILSSETEDAHYQLSVNIIDSSKNTVYQNVYNIMMKKEMIIDGAAHVFPVNNKFKAGKYRVVTSLRNVNLGDKKEREFDVNIQRGFQSTFRDMIIAENADLFFCPSSLTQIGAYLKSCYLFLDTSADKDSVIISFKIDEEVRRINVTGISNHSFNLLPILETGNIANLEIIYYTGNIADKRGWILYKSFDKYNQLFTKKDQLKQLKYIANQNEWKVISRLADKDIDRAIEYFWEKHNNSPGTFKNDLREIFYERVLKADELYTIHKKLPGWKSDRGKIYIKKGPPDEILEDSFPIGRYPYIEWHYYRDNTIYLFLDKSGYGNFQLEGEYYEN